MALTSNNLNDPSGFGAGKTQNFLIQYDDTLPDPNGVSPAANVITNADALIGVVENEFNVTTGWFGTPAGKFGTGHRQVVNLNLADTAGSGGSIGEPGANNSGYGSAINLDAQNLFADTTVGSNRVQNVFMAEWSEILMSVAGNWNAGDSSGEGLSQVLQHPALPDWPLRVLRVLGAVVAERRRQQPERGPLRLGDADLHRQRVEFTATATLSASAARLAFCTT